MIVEYSKNHSTETLLGQLKGGEAFRRTPSGDIKFKGDIVPNNTEIYVMDVLTGKTSKYGAGTTVYPVKARLVVEE